MVFTKLICRFVLSIINQTHRIMTTLESVTKALKENNFPTTGMYKDIPQMVYSYILEAIHFGVEKIEQSNLGDRLKNLTIELYEKDNRKSVICSKTLKNVII